MSPGRLAKRFAEGLGQGNGSDGLCSVLREAVFRRGRLDRPEPGTGVALRVRSDSRFGVSSHAAIRSGGARPR